MTDHLPVLVGVDGSSFADDALHWAVDEGRRRGVGVLAMLAWDFLHQLPLGDGPEFAADYHQQDADAALEALLERTLGPAAVSVDARAVFGLAAPVLLDHAPRAAMVVVGARGLGRLRGLLLGSVSQRLTHLCPVPLVLVRGTPVPDGDVLVGVDGSDASADALAWAVDEARARRCRLRVVSATRHGSSGLDATMLELSRESITTEARRSTAQMVANAAGEASDPPVEVAIVESEPALALVEAAADAALVVVGNPRHRSAREVMLGSVAQQVAQHAPCPTVLVPPVPR